VPRGEQPEVVELRAEGEALWGRVAESALSRGRLQAGYDPATDGWTLIRTAAVVYWEPTAAPS
jgi:hypothetical protein